jgi:hypothetical protein
MEGLMERLNPRGSTITVVGGPAGAGPAAETTSYVNAGGVTTHASAKCRQLEVESARFQAEALEQAIADRAAGRPLSAAGEWMLSQTKPHGGDTV